SAVFSNCTSAHRALHSFPTRRSSDLRAQVIGKNQSQTLPVLLHHRPNDAIKIEAPAAAIPLWPRFGMDHVCPDVKLGRRKINHQDRKSTRLNSSHVKISYAVFCLKKK